MNLIRYESEIDQLKRLKMEAEAGKRWTGLTPGRENIPGTIDALAQAIKQAEFTG